MDHLTPEHAAVFGLESVASSYVNRPPYPQAMIDRLRTFGGRVLEVGCGTAECSRRLAPHVERIDAVEPSAAMIAVGRAQPGGDAANLHWHNVPAEKFETDERYDLILTALSLHWMDWNVVLPKFARMLRPGGRHVIVYRRTIRDVPWVDAINRLVPQYSAMQNFRDFDLIEEVVGRGLFEVESREQFGPEPFRQSIDDYLDSWHSRAGFARERLTEQAANEFRAGIAAALQPHARDGHVEIDVNSSIVVGLPISP